MATSNSNVNPANNSAAASGTSTTTTTQYEPAAYSDIFGGITGLTKNIQLKDCHVKGQLNTNILNMQTIKIGDRYSLFVDKRTNSLVIMDIKLNVPLMRFLDGVCHIDASTLSFTNLQVANFREFQTESDGSSNLISSMYADSNGFVRVSKNTQNKAD